MKLLACALGVVLAACAGHGAGSIDEVVGAGCSVDSQCADRCYTGNADFPGGFCSRPCTSDADCPGDTVCATKAGGVCLFVCPPFDCAELGPGWHCSDKDLVGGGKANVCIGD
jgi:hypothetical protein